MRIYASTHKGYGNGLQGEEKEPRAAIVLSFIVPPVAGTLTRDAKRTQKSTLLGKKFTNSPDIDDGKGNIFVVPCSLIFLMT